MSNTTSMSDAGFSVSCTDVDVSTVATGSIHTSEDLVILSGDTANSTTGHTYDLSTNFNSSLKISSENDPLENLERISTGIEDDVHYILEHNDTDLVSRVKLRDKRYSVRKVPEKEKELQPMSTITHVHLRARGPDNLYMGLVHDELLMTRRVQHVFEKQEFWYRHKQCIVTTFIHQDTGRYVGVSLPSGKVILGDGPGSAGRDSFSPVVSLNGPSRLANPRPLSLDIDRSEDFDLAFLFIVDTRVHSCLRPVLSDNYSVERDVTDGSLRIAKGRKWAFKILPAREAKDLMEKVGGFEMFRKYAVIVIVGVYMMRH